jgi:hypothetical protein
MKEQIEWCYCIQISNGYNAGEFHSLDATNYEDAKKETLEIAKGYIDSKERIKSIQIAKSERVEVEAYFKAESLLDYIEDYVLNEEGEYAEPYAEELHSVSEDAKQELTDFMVSWAKKYNLQPSFSRVYEEEDITSFFI